jgi:hypothetical protein
VSGKKLSAAQCKALLDDEREWLMLIEESLSTIDGLKIELSAARSVLEHRRSCLRELRQRPSFPMKSSGGAK